MTQSDRSLKAMDQSGVTIPELGQGGAPAPLYAQIASVILREILSGRLADGDRLPPERDLAAEMNCAVGTLRKALGQLTQMGVLERVQGSGNYVRAGADIAGRYAFFHIELILGGGVPTAEPISVQRVRKSLSVVGLGGADPAWRIRRRRLLDGRLAAMEEIWIHGERCDHLDLAELDDALYLTYQRKMGLLITRATDRVTLGMVPEFASPDFGERPFAPCVLIERSGYAQDGTLAEMSMTWLDHNVARYVQRLG